jgi:hypothetical protein
MLDYGIIGKKQKTTIIKNGEQFDCIDLLTESFNKSTTLTGRPIVVNKHYVARPDLISLAIYSTDKYADILCKINGISNPFELNEDMIIICPYVDILNKLLVSNSTGCELVNKNASVTNGQNSNGTTTTNSGNILYNNDITENKEQQIGKQTDNKNLQKSPSERRSSSDQVVGDVNYVIDKTLGIVIY